MTAQGFYAVLPNNPRYNKDVFERIDATLDVISYDQAIRESCNVVIKSFFALTSANPSSLDVRFRASMDLLTLELGVKTGQLLESPADIARIERAMDGYSRRICKSLTHLDGQASNSISHTVRL